MDLFSDGADSQGSPLDAWLSAFQRWGGDAPGKKGPMQRQSVAVYEDMWRALCQWCVVHQVDLLEISPGELDRYLASREGSYGPALHDRYAWRLLRLVERVLAKHAVQSGAPFRNPVERLLAQRPELRYANARHHDTPVDFLQPAQARVLVAILLASGELQRWQDLRNLCAVALHLGAGLTPLELRELSCADVLSTSGTVGHLYVRANGTVKGRRTPIAPWARRVLQRWLQQRAVLAIPSDVLLPSTRTGKQWSKTNHDEAVRGVMASAGLAPAGGAYRLRHTFCIRQLQRGRPPEVVAQWLGVEPAAMSRYVEVGLQTFDPV